MSDTNLSPYRVYNHSDRELIIATDDARTEQFRLMARSTSPFKATPRFLWAASGAVIDGALVWELTPGYDVHVTEAAPGPSVGDEVLINPTAATPNLHIYGLGTKPTPDPIPPDVPRRAWFYREDEIWVTVLGAGITGLTAAHELVTRGFRVQVIERAHGSPADIRNGDTGVARFQRGLTGPDIGGIARTQWTTQPLLRGGTQLLRGDPPTTPGAMRSVHGDALWFGADRGGPQTSTGSASQYQAFGVTWSDGKLDDFARDLNAWLHDLERPLTHGIETSRSVAAVQLVVVVYGGDLPDRVPRAYRRFHEFVASLASGGPDAPDSDLKQLMAVLDRLQVLPTARIDVPEPEPRQRFVGLIVRVHDDLGLVAGEHGFRFFPGFYRHLRDTMRRTPIFDPVTQTFTPRTALDNLQEVEWQVIVDPTRSHQAPLSRKPFTTIGGLIEQYRAIRRDTGYRPVDLLRFSLRMLRYMTSSTERRQAYYEDMSWWTFVSKLHLDDPRDERSFNYGQRFAEALRHSPKALVAMASERADARTQGNISVQMLMDQFGLHDESDSTLNGPTSTNWLAHWRTYLVQQGVRFFLGEVTSIDYVAGRADVQIVFPTGEPPVDYLFGEAALARDEILTHYVVSALDVVSLARVSKNLRRLQNVGVFSDLSKLVTDSAGNDRDLEDITQVGVELGDRFQTLTGIQLYYQRHISFANGHIYFASSPWGLSAISQIQFWGPFGSGHRARLAGNLSIDIGSWRADGATPSPNDLVRDDIAAHVQTQISGIEHIANPGRPIRPTDVVGFRRAHFYHLDDFIGFAADPTRPELMRPQRNHAPFLINVAGDWNNRPAGEPWSPNDVAAWDRAPGTGTPAGALWIPARGGYVVHFDNLVVAGTHMRTFTRMGTMEAANESARHAVNAILDHATYGWKQTHPDAISGAPATPDINVDKNTTRYGDYCDIWNPEQLEPQDLEFLRSIDSQLMAASAKTQDDDAPPGAAPLIAPHLFDILHIDELPDALEDDRDAVNALELIGSILKAFDDARVDDLPGVFAIIDGARKKLAGMFQRRSA